MKNNIRRKNKMSQIQKNKKNFKIINAKKMIKTKNEKSSSRQLRDNRKKNSFKSSDKKFKSSNIICFIYDKKNIFYQIVLTKTKKNSVYAFKNMNI